MSARSGDDELRRDQSRLLPCLEGSFFFPVEFVGKVPFGREGRLGGYKGMSRVIVIFWPAGGTSSA